LVEAGFDGIEIDVGETGILRQFLSPLTNHRTDEYGGDLPGRLRLTTEVLEAIRARIDKDIPVGIRLCLDEVFWGALAIEDATAAAEILENHGLTDFFNTAIGTYYNLHLTRASMHTPEGFTIDRVSMLKSKVNVPVFAANRLHTPELAEQVLSAGQADLIGWVRPLICDPYLPAKLASGDTDEVVHCVSDNQNCLSRTSRLKPIGCIQNPWAGREIERPAGLTAACSNTTAPTPDPCRSKTRCGLRVMVVGAGPAGLQAALTAARLGHETVLYERESEAGGQVRLARLGAGRAAIWGVVENLTRRLRKAGVEVLTDSPMDCPAILSERPDVVIVTVGSFPDPKPIRGNYAEPMVLNVWQALRRPELVGERVLLLDGDGHHKATATAEYLADLGRKVDIMTSEPFVGMDLAGTGDLYLTRQRLLQKGVSFLPDRTVLEIDGTTLLVADKFTEKESTVTGYDTVVSIMGNIPDETLYLELKGHGMKVLRAGDCVAPRRIDMAVLEGNRAGLLCGEAGSARH
ncbi:MAG: FAD-dependent oxidoreductase, partial [Pseudomonadota bacterium]